MTCQMRYPAENCRASGHSRCRHQDRCVIIKRDGVNMPGAEAEAKAAAMDNAVDVWRLNTASRLHMVCTWWEWKCSESNWQTIALDSDDRAVGHSYAIRGRMRLPVAPFRQDGIEAREVKRMELCAQRRPVKPYVPCGWRKDSGQSETIERWRNM